MEELLHYNETIYNRVIKDRCMNSIKKRPKCPFCNSENSMRIIKVSILFCSNISSNNYRYKSYSCDHYKCLSRCLYSGFDNPNIDHLMNFTKIMNSVKRNISSYYKSRLHSYEIHRLSIFIHYDNDYVIFRYKKANILLSLKNDIKFFHSIENDFYT